MAPRNMEKLLADYAEKFGKPFDFDGQVALLTASGIFTQDAAEAMVKAGLVKLLPTSSATADDRDYVAEFIANSEHDALLKTAQNAVVSLLNAINTVRDNGSKVNLFIDLKGATASEVVKLVNRKITRDNVKRNWKLAGQLLIEYGATELTFKANNETHVIKVKVGKPKSDAESGLLIYNGASWVPFETIKTFTQPILDQLVASGARKTATANLWLDVKVGKATNEDVINNSLMTIYDARYDGETPITAESDD